MRFLRKHRNQILLHLILLPFMLIFIYPIFWTLISSFKTDQDVFSNLWGLPTFWNVENYFNVWNVARLDRAFFNSLYISFFTVLIVIIITILASYAFSQDNSKFMKIIFIAFIATFMLPADVLFLTIFFQIRDLGLINSFWGVILPSAALGMTFSIFILTNFMKELPQSILDSATIDGCSRFRLLTSIVVPLVREPIFVLIIFQFTATWNSFILPLVVLRRPDMLVLPQVLAGFIGQLHVRYTEMFAAIIITFIPVLVLFVLFQRSFIQGMSQGALKE